MSNKPRIWETLCDGEYELINLEDADVEEALEVLDAYFLNECVAIGTEVNLPENSQAREELRELCRVVSKEYVSLAVRHVPTNKLAAVAFNVVQFVDDTRKVPFFIEFRDKKCKSPNAITYMNYMISMDQEVDPFKQYNIDCMLELMFLVTLPEHGRHGLASALGKYTIALARELGQGIGIERLPSYLHNRIIKAVTALFTSNFSQKVGRANKFKVLNRVPHSKFVFNGKSFSERIGPMHPASEQVIYLL